VLALAGTAGAVSAPAARPGPARIGSGLLLPSLAQARPGAARSSPPSGEVDGVRPDSGVPPLTLGNVLAGDLFTTGGGFSQYDNIEPTVTNTTSGPATGTLSVQWGTGSSFQLYTGGQAAVPGTMYDPLTDLSVTISADIDGVTCDSTGAGSLAYAEVDQYTYTPSSGATSTVDTMAVQFECLDLDTGELVYATLAYQIEPTTPGLGYYLYSSEGGLAGYGNDNYLLYLGQPGFLPLNAPIAGMATTADGGGYWMVGTDGGVFAYGDAKFHGSAGNLVLNRPIVGMAATADGGGYWLVATDGGIFAYGDARFHGSAGNLRLNQPIVGMAATADGGGYWLVAADGGIFAYGDARFHGSAGDLILNDPIVGMAPTADGGGYWLVATDGGIFAYGDARFHGSAGNLVLNAPVAGMLPTADGGGYWLVATDGGIFAYGDARFEGSSGGGDSGVIGMVR
jgi:ribosomal protein S8